MFKFKCLFWGLSLQLIPWIITAEKSTSVVLEKPRNLSHAQDIEKQCATFAKVIIYCSSALLHDIMIMVAGGEGCQQDADKDWGTCQQPGYQQGNSPAPNRGTGKVSCFLEDSDQKIICSVFFQKLRFKKIAEVAATRVEHMRDLLIRWDQKSTV